MRDNNVRYIVRKRKDAETAGVWQHRTPYRMTLIHEMDLALSKDLTSAFGEDGGKR
jgi:hypothetical protein